MRKKSGFTLIELLVVIGILAILAGVVIVAVNPARQFAQTRNTQRRGSVLTVLNAVNQNMVDNGGNFACAAGSLPTSSVGTNMGSASGSYDIAPCIVPTYIPSMPFDPQPPAFYTSTSSYDTQFLIYQNPSTGQITVTADQTEIPPASTTISVTR